MSDGWLTFIVEGTPAGQGSKRHVGNGVMIEQSKRVKPWRAAVVAAAKRFVNDQGVQVTAVSPWFPKHVPVELDVTFVRARPASAPRHKREYPVVPPDADKELRATCDALTTAHIWHDDAQMVDAHLHDRYQDGQYPIGSGAIIRVRRIGRPADSSPPQSPPDAATTAKE